MSSKSIIVNDETLKKIKHFYQDSLIDNKNQHALFMAKSNNTTITAYKSMKVLFQGENAEYEASIFESFDGTKATSPKKKTNQNQQEMNHDYYLPSIGSDEVGTGDYFGPVVVVSAYVDEQALKEIKSLKIDDSKKLTDKDILEIAPKLYQILPYSLLIVHNEKYNDLMMGDMNLNKLKAMLHKQAITNLLKKIQLTPHIIIDKFCEVQHFNRYVGDTKFIKTTIFTTKAESKYLSVACASIMARYAFLQQMDQLSDKIDMILLKGASDAVDQQAAKIVQLHGFSQLNQIAKLHFKNTDKVKQKLSMK